MSIKMAEMPTEVVDVDGIRPCWVENSDKDDGLTPGG